MSATNVLASTLEDVFPSKPHSEYKKSLDIALVTLLAIPLVLLIYRLLMMWFLPLADTTEARYGEIARLTLEHGFWLMPHIDIDTPFFAKPPFSTWMASASMFLFGVTEFAARLPSMLAALLTALVATSFAAAYNIKRTWLVLPILASCPLFFISAGAVMTDAVQLCVVTAALYFAWRAIEPELTQSRETRRLWRIAFWSMVGIGALCKGLADWALIGMPLIAYAIVIRKPIETFKQLFDWSGAMIAIAIFLPWYIAAEYYNPGFLNYFIVGEHFSRFLVPSWKGDRYGIAHVHPLGTIWIFWAVAIFPWVGVFTTELFKYFKKSSVEVIPLERFLWCATLMPLIFFTFAHNIIWTYGLTSIVPFSIIVARWIEGLSAKKFLLLSLSLLALVAASILCWSLIIKNVSGNSDRDLVNIFHKKIQENVPLIYRIKPSYSSSFYTKGNLIYQPLVASGPNQMATDKYSTDVVENSNIDGKPILFKGTRHSLVLEK